MSARAGRRYGQPGDLAGFGVKRTDGEVKVIDGEGKVTAGVGQEIYTGGGEVPSVSAVGQTRLELRERCPGPFWIAAPPVRTPPQEKW